jgi:type I restriction enzyme R subunit
MENHNMSERSAVQNPLIRYAEAAGWRRASREEALRLRGGESGLYFTEILRDKLLALNPGIVDAERASDILRRLSLFPASIEGNREALGWLHGEGSVYVPEEKRERNVTLIDYSDLSRNDFAVTDEWVQRGPVFRNRADVVFLVNGVPVAICETKNATHAQGAAEGVEQIRRYHRETPELFTTTQVFEVTQLLDFLYGATWAASRKDLFNWKDVEPGDFEAKVRRFFEPAVFLRLLREYILFLTRDDALTKVILRQHQMRAPSSSRPPSTARSRSSSCSWTATNWRASFSATCSKRASAVPTSSSPSATCKTCSPATRAASSSP